jgi:Hypothetical protein APE1804
MKVHEMLRYAYNHGVAVIALENPEVLGYLRLTWIRSGDRKHENYNYKISVFRSSVIERIAVKAPLYGLNTKFVKPEGDDKLQRTRWGYEEVWAGQAHGISIHNSLEKHLEMLTVIYRNLQTCYSLFMNSLFSFNSSRVCGLTPSGWRMSNRAVTNLIWSTLRS